MALALCVWAGCKDKAKGPTSELDQRCEKLGKTCGDNDKHVEKIVDECKQAAKKQVDKGCAAKVTAAYDCYEKELCGKTDKVWAIDDFRVLSGRKSKCVAEEKAASDCVGQ